MTLTVNDEWASQGTVDRPDQAKINQGYVCETASPEILNWHLNNLTKLGIQLIRNGTMPYLDAYKEDYGTGALVNYNGTTYQRLPNTDTPVPAPDGPNGNLFWTAFAGFARDLRIDNGAIFEVSDTGDPLGGPTRTNFDTISNAVLNAPLFIQTTIALNTSSNTPMGNTLTNSCG